MNKTFLGSFLPTQNQLNPSSGGEVTVVPRERSPNRDKAFEVFRDSGGKIANREIANQLGIPEKTVGGWKAKDSWLSKINGVLQTTERSTPKHAGAPAGNQNAVGNRGGDGGPVGNAKAVTHGFFRRIFPDDDETLAIVDDIASMDPLDMLWQNIVIQYAAIARAQRIMFVQDAGDHSEFVIAKSAGVDSEMETKMIQPSWDKHANFLQAQSRAMKTLEGLISRYEELLPTSSQAEQHRLKIEKLKADIDKVRGNGPIDEGLSVVVDYGDDDG